MSDLSAQEVEAIVAALANVLREDPTLIRGQMGADGAPKPVESTARGVKIHRSVESIALQAGFARWVDPDQIGVGENVFATIDQAVDAARAAYVRFRAMKMADRARFIAAIRAYASKPEVLDALANNTVVETGMGIVAHKRWKTEIAALHTPGVEDLTCAAFSGDNGLTTVEYSPYGVVGAITPTTNPTATIINNTISLLAAGNTVVFSPHPRAKKVSIELIKALNAELIEAGAPANLIVTIAQPGRPTTQALFDHPGINLIVATGGSALVGAAMKSGKKVIGAGAGNPPVVVDHTADVPHAAKCIVDGASFDNNLPCIAEKAIVAVDSVADMLTFNMEKHGAYHLRSQDEIARLEAVILDEHGKGKPEWIGQSATSILEAMGVTPPAGVRLITLEVGPSHPVIVNELMMPVLGLVRVRSVGAAIELAVRIEGGNRHTAVMHSRDVTALTAMGRAIGTTIFVKNGPSFAGLGMGGEGFATFTIAGPTGEGLTTARSFSRSRRCVLVGDLHMG